MPDQPAPAPPGRDRLAGRYRLVRPIASGGMAQVWEAVDEVLDRPVAVKVLHPHLASDAVFVARFRAEAVNAARLTHPGIVSIFDTWSGDGTEAIVMELVRGTTLRHLLDVRGALQPGESVTIAEHVAGALGAAHRAGIVHRDIKPANVLLADDRRVLVADFGIAKAVAGADLTLEPSMLGTAKYLAPEQVEGGPVDPRTDIYALGVVLYEMLCGEVPFRADTEAATALARLQRAPDRPSVHRPGLSASLEAVVLACLARRPDDRPTSADDLRERLAAVDRRLGPPTAPPSAIGPPPAAVGADPPPPPPAGTPRPWRRSTIVLLAIGSLACLVAAVVVYLRQSPPVGPLAVSHAAAFDPLGHPPGQENNADAHFAIDGNVSTAWSTETYRDPAHLGKLGVGLVVTLGRVRRVTSLSVTSSSTGWVASIYAVTGAPVPTFPGWGTPVAGLRASHPGTLTFALHGVRADALLIWITRTGHDGRVTIAEVDLRGR